MPPLPSIPEYYTALLPPQKEMSKVIYSIPLILKVKNMNPEMLSDQPKVIHMLVEKPELEPKFTSLMWYLLYLLW